MAIYKRGNTYWYKFMWQGKLVRESTKQGNDKVARQMEAAGATLLDFRLLLRRLPSHQRLSTAVQPEAGRD